MAAGSRDRPSMLAPGRYPQWRSRFLRYVDTRPNGEALRKCILSGPYKLTTVLVQVVEATNHSPSVLEHTTVETPTNMSPENKAHFLVEKEAIHLILTGIGDDIYSTVDACQTAQEIQHDMSEPMLIVVPFHNLEIGDSNDPTLGVYIKSRFPVNREPVKLLMFLPLVRDSPKGAVYDESYGPLQHPEISLIQSSSNKPFQASHNPPCLEHLVNGLYHGRCSVLITFSPECLWKILHPNPLQTIIKSIANIIELQTSGSGNTFLLAVPVFFRQWEVPSNIGNFLTSSGNALCILFPTILP
nr:hypothetical protein [Tanacetum cinerariifolium]